MLVAGVLGVAAVMASCERFIPHAFLVDSCRDCKQPEADHETLIDEDDEDSEEEENEVDCSHFVPHFFIWYVLLFHTCLFLVFVVVFAN